MILGDLLWLLVTEFFLVVPFSYLFFGDTWIYAIAESTLVGGLVAYSFFNLTKSLVSMVSANWTMIIPLIIGILAFSRLTKYEWLANYPVSLLAGLGVGVVFASTISAQILGQVKLVLNDIVTSSPDPFSPILVFIGAVTVVSYFLYTARISAALHTGRLKYVSRIGRIFLFVSFGYLFATDFFTHEPYAFIDQALRQFLTKLGVLA